VYRLGNEPLGLTEVLISVVTGCVLCLSMESPAVRLILATTGPRSSITDNRT